MISSTDVNLSSTVIDNDLPSSSPPPLKSINSTAPSSFLDDLLIECNLLDFNTIDILQLDGDEMLSFLDESLEDFDQAQTITFNAELPTALEQHTLSFDNDAMNDQSKATDSTQTNILPLDSGEIDNLFNRLLDGFDLTTSNAELSNSRVENKATDPIQTDIPLFDSEQIVDLIDELLEGFDSTTFDGELLNSLEQSTFSSKDQLETNERQLTETTRNNSVVIKTSNFNTRSNLINTTQLCRTGQSFKLHTSPYLFQRARYENELERDLRYISTPNNNCIDFEMFELRNHMPMNTKVIVRVTRTTIPYGPNGIVYCHPYPLWVKDTHAMVHHGSLLIDITDQIMNNQPIKLEYLLMQRLKQDPLKAITQWPIYTSNQLDCNGFDSLNTSKPKTIIERYNLRYSILHFQIFLVDENQTAYPTDLSCETTPIFEYEDKDRKDHPEIFGLERKHQTKRLQRQPTTIQQKNGFKNKNQVKRKTSDGPYPRHKC